MNPAKKAAGCCNDVNYMADNKKQCDNAHFQGVTFANEDYGCPVKTPDVNMGAVIGR